MLGTRRAVNKAADTDPALREFKGSETRHKEKSNRQITAWTMKAQGTLSLKCPLEGFLGESQAERGEEDIDVSYQGEGTAYNDLMLVLEKSFPVCIIREPGFLLGVSFTPGHLFFLTEITLCA